MRIKNKVTQKTKLSCFFYFKFCILCKIQYNYKVLLSTILGGCRMLNAKEAMERTEQARKKNLKGEWQKLAKDIK